MTSSAARILLVEDDDRFAALVSRYLTQHGFVVSREASGEAGAQHIQQTPPDAVVLDMMLPGLSGLDVCRQVRATFSGPILILTASQSVADHVSGLELGADDFITKPIEPRVLVARLRTQLRRAQRAGPQQPPAPPTALSVGALTLDLALRHAHVGERQAPLTSMEFGVLLVLVRSAGDVVTRDDLYETVLNTAYDGIDRGMDVHISRIRKKLAGCGFNPKNLRAVRGAGYLLVAR